MSKPIKLIIMLGLVVVAGAGMVAVRDMMETGTAEDILTPLNSRIYSYHDPLLSISKVSLRIIYAVPADKNVDAEWQANLDRIIKEVTAFHQVQFGAKTQIKYEINNTPVVLPRKSAYYSGRAGTWENDALLEQVDKDVDESSKTFIQSGSYPVLVYVFEGSGLAGADGKMIIGTNELSDNNALAGTFFYHAFAHTLGIPDKYDAATNSDVSADIMGMGRFRPLGINFIDKETLRKMGVHVL